MNLDRIMVEDLQVDCIIGVLPAERERTQRLRLWIWAEMDLTAAAASDRVHDTLDYAVVADAVRDMAVAGRFGLLETLALRVCDHLLTDRRVLRAGITVRKPGAIAGAAAAALSMERGRP